ncbi:hypothetical protein B0H19DRAFT_475932 [Mycena capillaripes]|nr:hypothetical protein B0H19DRAFT_475932 [Mycena capillaripes]
MTEGARLAPCGTRPGLSRGRGAAHLSTRRLAPSCQYRSRWARTGAPSASRAGTDRRASARSRAGTSSRTSGAYSSSLRHTPALPAGQPGPHPPPTFAAYDAPSPPAASADRPAAGPASTLSSYDSAAGFATGLPPTTTRQEHPPAAAAAAVAPRDAREYGSSLAARDRPAHRASSNEPQGPRRQHIPGKKRPSAGYSASDMGEPRRIANWWRIRRRQGRGARRMKEGATCAEQDHDERQGAETVRPHLSFTSQ